ncbi:MAG: DUF421 domain-containing protein [Bacteroidota bacterium]
MENWLYASLPVIFKVVGTVVGIYITLIVITRIAGLRTFADITSVDFTSTIAIGSMLGIIILNETNSLLKGAVAIVTVIAIQALFTYLSRRYNFMKRAISNQPILLMINGKILEENLIKVNLRVEDLMVSLRKENVKHLLEVHAMVFETTGDISVIHGDDSVDEIILSGIQTNNDQNASNK